MFFVFVFIFFQADPKQVCTALGLCDSKKSKKVDAKLVARALPLKNHFKTILAPVLVAAKLKPAVIKSKPLKASAECILCEFVMKELDSILQENATKVWKHASCKRRFLYGKCNYWQLLLKKKKHYSGVSK